jgi:hypothetical protein
MKPIEHLVLRDRAGCMWLLGLMFLGGGTLVLASWLMGKLGSDFKAWEIAAVAVIGIAHFSAGAWLLVSTPSTSVKLHHDRPVLELSRTWLLARKARLIHLDEVLGFHVHTSADSDGDPVYYLELDLRDGQTLRLNAVGIHGRTAIDEATARLREWSGGRIAARIRSPRDRVY